MKTVLKNKIFSWFRLVRLPNLFTAPGDVVCGFLLAGGSQQSSDFIYLFCGCWIAFFAYAFGIITNDIADVQEDMRIRPERPIPSGAISRKEALFGVFICLCFILIPSFISWKLCFATVVLLTFICLYNFYFKTKPLLGPVFMALCRIQSFGVGIIGLVPIPFSRIGVIALFSLAMFLYILGITCAAENEDKRLSCRKGRKQLFCGAIFAICVVVIQTISVLQYSCSFLTLTCSVFVLLLLFVFLYVSVRAIRVFSEYSLPSQIQFYIGMLVRNTLLIHSSLCFSFGWIVLAFVFLFSYFSSSLVRKLIQEEGS